MVKCTYKRSSQQNVKQRGGHHENMTYSQNAQPRREGIMSGSNHYNVDYIWVLPIYHKNFPLSGSIYSCPWNTCEHLIQESSATSSTSCLCCTASPEFIIVTVYVVRTKNCSLFLFSYSLCFDVHFPPLLVFLQPHFSYSKWTGVSDLI